MANTVKINFLAEIKERYGNFKKLNTSLSLFDIGETRIYIRYSKVHGKDKTFYGLRDIDLKELEGKNSIIVFLWDNQKEPLFIPFGEFEEVFNYSKVASDGQYKAQVYLREDGIEFYVAGGGKFNVESFMGWKNLEKQIDKNKIIDLPDLSHFQIQTFLGFIGVSKGYNIWVPHSDRARMDWNLAPKFSFRKELPIMYENIFEIVNEIDVIWLKKGTNQINSLFEVEHSTPIYSGLLRFNDFFLVTKEKKLKFNIVSNDERRSLFTKQINRPTFQVSGLGETCNFLEYKDVFGWFERTKSIK